MSELLGVVIINVYSRMSAKQHYLWTHLQKGQKRDSNWYEVSPEKSSWSRTKKKKATVSIQPVKKRVKLPKDFLVCSSL